MFPSRPAIQLPLIALTSLAAAGCTPNCPPAQEEQNIADNGGGDWPQWGGTVAKNMVSNATGISTDFDPGRIKKSSGESDMATSKQLTGLGADPPQ